MTRHHPTWSEVRHDYMRSLVPMDATCAVCRWWYPRSGDASDEVGWCHRHPPTHNGWPQTNGDQDVCGAWETDYQPVDRDGKPCEAGPLWAVRGCA